MPQDEKLEERAGLALLGTTGVESDGARRVWEMGMVGAVGEGRS